MSFFEFPHTRTYDSDLGWIIRKVKELNGIFATISDRLKITLKGNFDITASYPMLSLVYDPSDSLYYIALQDVPTNTPLSNTEYWQPFNYETTDIGDLIARVEALEELPDKVDRLANENKTVTDSMVVIAHRGGGQFAPENTLEGIQTGAVLGYKCVEVDVNYTYDNIPVLLHDNTIDRTSNGTGNIREMTFTQASQYNYNQDSTVFTSCALPTVQAALRIVKELGIRIEFDCGNRGLPESIVSAVYNEVEKLSMNKQVQFAFSYSDYQRFIPLVGDSMVTVLCTTQAQIDAVIAYSETITNTVIYSMQLDYDLVQYCTDKKLPVKVWTVNVSTTVWTLFKTYSVVMVTTDSAAPRQRSKIIPVFTPYNNRITVTNQNTVSLGDGLALCTALFHVEVELAANQTTVATVQPPFGSYAAPYTTYGIAFLNSGGNVRNIGVAVIEQPNQLNIKHEQVIPAGSYINVLFFINFSSDLGL